MEKIVQVDTYEAERKQLGALPPTPDGGMRNRQRDEKKPEMAQEEEKKKNSNQRLARIAKDIMGKKMVKGIDPCKLVKTA